MARIPKLRRRPDGDAASRAAVTITQAQYMIRIYSEILAMDETIMERVRQLVVKESENGEREADLTNMRLILAQLEKIGRRIAYWNSRVRALLKEQLSR
jgi:hypothetical protein